MTEYYTVIDKRKFGYEGYFRPKELFQVLRKFLREHGYFPLEMQNYEEVYEHGRQVYVELRPFKQISDYMKQEMYLRIELKRLKDVVVEVDGVKRNYMSGNVSITSDAVIRSDYKSKWEGAGWMYFFRVMNDKFIRKDWVSKSKADVARDLDELLEELRSFLNMVKFKGESMKEINNNSLRMQ